MKIWSATSNFNRKSEVLLQKITRFYYIELWLLYLLPEIIWQGDVLHFCRLGKEGSYLVGGEACYATAYAGDEEMLVGMQLGVGYELIDIRTIRLKCQLSAKKTIANIQDYWFTWKSEQINNYTHHFRTSFLFIREKRRIFATELQQLSLWSTL